MRLMLHPDPLIRTRDDFAHSLRGDGQPVAERVIQDGVRAHRDVGRDGHAWRDMEIRRHVAQAFDTIATIPSSLSHGSTTASG